MTTSGRPSSPDIFPTARQSVVTFLGGAGLAAGTCAGLWVTFDLSGTSVSFVVMFVSCVVSFGVAGVGAILVLTRQLRLLLRRTPAEAALPRVKPAGAAAMEIPPSSPAWPPFVNAVGLLVAAVIAFFGLELVDTSPLAVIFVSAICAILLASVVFFAIALVRFIRGR